MVLDDDEHMREVLELCLHADGHSVHCEGSASSALAAFRATRWDVLVVDRVMPEITGAGFGMMVRKIEPQIPLVLISGIALNECGEESIFDAFVRKPFTRASLRMGIQKALCTRGRD